MYDARSHLCRPGFYKKLVEALPAITVIYVRTSGAELALRIADETEFMAVVREFLTLPEHLGKRR